jgi:DNA-binding CsgD family transcriptional regulator
MAASGLDNASIAKARACSPRTVANLLQSVYRKLDVSSRAELARRMASGA